MLTRFEAQGFKLLRDVAVDLSPLTVLVGANGSGKTTVLDGIDWVLSDSRPGVQPTDESSADSLGSRRLGDQFSRPAGDRLRLSLLTSDRPAMLLKRTRRDASRGEQARPSDERPARFAPVPPRPEVSSHASHLRLQLDTQRLAEPSMAATGRAKLAADGMGLATVLQDVASLRDGTIDAIEADLTSLVPDFRRVHTSPVELTWDETDWLEVEGRRFPRVTRRSGGGFRLELAFDHVGRIPAAEVSEGTLLALGLITALRVDVPDLILLDDAERALHPLAQQGLVQLLHDAIARSEGRLQIIATTHSPYLVDACKPEEVRVFRRKPDGSAAVRALTEHPEAAKWRELLETGEFWSSVGEGWVAEVEAASEAAR